MQYALLVLRSSVWRNEGWMLSAPRHFLPDLAGDAGLQIAHPVVKLLLLDAGWTEIGTSAADRLIRFRIGAAELTGGTDIHAGPAQAAHL